MNGWHCSIDFPLTTTSACFDHGSGWVGVRFAYDGFKEWVDGWVVRWVEGWV